MSVCCKGDNDSRVLGKRAGTAGAEEGLLISVAREASKQNGIVDDDNDDDDDDDGEEAFA